MKKIECSKKILIVSYVTAITATIIVIGLTLAGVSASDFSAVVLAIWGEVAAANSFYLMKARRENKAKYAQEFIKELADTYGIENVTSVLGIVLQD